MSLPEALTPSPSPIRWARVAFPSALSVRLPRVQRIPRFPTLRGLCVFRVSEVVFPLTSELCTIHYRLSTIYHLPPPASHSGSPLGPYRRIHKGPRSVSWSPITPDRWPVAGG